MQLFFVLALMAMLIYGPPTKDNVAVSERNEPGFRNPTGIFPESNQKGPGRQALFQKTWQPTAPHHSV